MKKTISLMLVLVCLMSVCSATAETSFLLHNGITFGESSKTVCAKENWAQTESGHLFQYQGKFMGMPSLVRYNFGVDGYFGKNDSLMSVLYCVNTSYDEDGKTHYSQKSLYKTLSVSLSRKWGAPLTNPVYLRRIQMDPFVEFYIYLQSCAPMKDRDFEYLATEYVRAVWIIPEGDREVVVDLLEYKMNQNGQPCFLTLLNYSAYTSQEMQEIQEFFETTFYETMPLSPAE